MSDILLWITLIVGLAACSSAILAFIAARSASRALSDRGTEAEKTLARIQETESALAKLFREAQADMAGRLEKVQADLRIATADRLSQVFNSMRDSVDKQLETGRREQNEALARISATLEEKLNQATQAQTRGLADSREEMAKRLGESREEMSKALAQMTKNLELRFESLSAKTAQNLETIRDKVDKRLEAISEQVQKKLDENIKEGFSQFEKVQEHLKNAEERLKEVGQVGASIHDLNALLKMPHLRGRFGETTLEHILADFLPREMYELQAGIAEGDRLRADALILLPDRKLPIDSKFPREQVLALFESNDPADLAKARSNLDAVVKKQAADIAKYIKTEDGTTDMALMFLPSETLWFEVIQNASLCEYLTKQHVFPVSPNTLLVTLHAIRLSHKWYEVAKGFEDTRNELERANKSFRDFRSRFDDIGKQLQKAQGSYQTASGHLDRYRNRVTKLTGEAFFELEGSEESGSAPEP